MYINDLIVVEKDGTLTRAEWVYFRGSAFAEKALAAHEWTFFFAREGEIVFAPHSSEAAFAEFFVVPRALFEDMKAQPALCSLLPVCICGVPQGAKKAVQLKNIRAALDAAAKWRRANPY